MSKDFVPYLNITSHLDTTPDSDMLSAKGGNAFPTVIFMSHDGAVLTDEFLFPESAEVVKTAMDAALANLASLNTFREKAAAMPDDKTAAANLRLALALRHAGNVSPDEFAAMAKLPGIDATLVKRFEILLLVSEMDVLRRAAGEVATSREEYMEVYGKGIFAMFKAGKRLPIDHDEATTFYGLTMDHAITLSDGATAAAAFAEFEKAMNLIAEQRPEFKDRISSQVDAKRAEVEALKVGAGN